MKKQEYSSADPYICCLVTTGKQKVTRGGEEDGGSRLFVVGAVTCLSTR